MTTMHPAIAAGVAVTEADVAEFDRVVAAAGVDVLDLVTAITRHDKVTLDNLGVHIKAPPIPCPAPAPDVVERLAAMYGFEAGDTSERNLLRWDAANRTAVAMERRRQGWTRQGAMEEFMRTTLAAVQEAADQ